MNESGDPYLCGEIKKVEQWIKTAQEVLAHYNKERTEGREHDPFTKEAMDIIERAIPQMASKHSDLISAYVKTLPK